MTDLIVKGTERLEGTVKASPSKAYTHRVVIAASLSNGQSMIKEPSNCDDALATIRACSMLGAKIRRKEHATLVIDGISKPKTPKNIIDCGGSASTIRFMSSICSLADRISVLTGNRSLQKRPIQPLLDALNQLEARCTSIKDDGTPPIVTFGGGIEGGETSLVGDISSQFISSLLLSTPKAKNETKIAITTQLESKPYITMTLDVLRKHDIKADYSSDYHRFFIPCEQEYHSTNHSIEGDYSSAAFILAAAALTKSNVKVTNLKKNTLQGDRIILDILKEMGVTVDEDEDYVEVTGANSDLTGFEIDLRDAPDLIPICVVLACFANGETTINGIGRLRFKESNRVASLISELAKMGGKIIVDEDSFIIEGKASFQGAELYSHKDHRIAMSCAVAALCAKGKTTIRGIECVRKSYPNFVEDLRFLGGKVLGG
jgi:3-phosphoshikimate 1-carboxyvinyltransferase